jgi:hypothetical protein
MKYLKLPKLPKLQNEIHEVTVNKKWLDKETLKDKNYDTAHTIKQIADSFKLYRNGENITHEVWDFAENKSKIHGENTLLTDDDNRVVSIQPHFYKEAQSEEERIKKDYMNIPLHQVLESMYIAFRTYHVIRRYADYRGVKILNITPNSFVDAFARLKI